MPLLLLIAFDMLCTATAVNEVAAIQLVLEDNGDGKGGGVFGIIGGLSERVAAG